MTTTKTRTPIRQAIGIGAAAVAAGAAAFGVGLHGGPTAQADPGDGGPVFGTSLLLQSDDITNVPQRLDNESIKIYGGDALSACTGETPLYHYTKGIDPEPLPSVSSVWSSDRITDETLTQTVTQARSEADAAKVAATLVTALKTCQHEPKGHWHYGREAHPKAGNGAVTYLVAYNGDGTPNGGVAVSRKGANISVVEITDPAGDSKAAIVELAVVALNKLG